MAIRLGALAGLAAAAGLVLYLCASPLSTADLWWQLAHGRAVAAEGPWLESDPCLHTAAAPPAPHQWLFGLGVYGVERLAGLHGLRALHLAVGIALVGLAFSFLRRASGSLEWAAFATCAFLVLGWYRITQLRPEIVSMLALFVVYRLVVEPEGAPSWRRVAGAALVLGLWANFHALFMVAPLLLVAVAVGCGMRAALARVAGGDGAAASRRALRLASAAGLGMLAALANPRGLEQHLAFLRSSRSGAIWVVVDEWAAFDPFAHTNFAAAVSLLAWALTDVLLLGFAAVALFAGVRFLRRRDRESLDALDPALLALAGASCVAMLASIRFAWLSIFPLLYVAHAWRRALPGGGPAGARAAAALACVALAGAFVASGGARERAVNLSRGPWLAPGASESTFYAEGVAFLAATGLEGNLFNTYEMGGYLCWRLGPRMRTFVDGSMNFPGDVFREYRRLLVQRGDWPGESAAALLDRRGVDVYFGVGLPLGRRDTPEGDVYTTANLERVEGWRLVSRSLRHSIYVRANPRNRENLRRVEAWYARQRVPFDRQLDVVRVIEERPGWAARTRLIPQGYLEFVKASSEPDATARHAALEARGLALALAGAYAPQAEVDAAALALRPEARTTLERAVWGSLRLHRPDEALDLSRRLVAAHPEDRRSRLFAQAATNYWKRSREGGGAGALPIDHVINQLPLLRSKRPLSQ